MSFIPMEISERSGVELVGTAQKKHVLYGKTFYNTDPDNKLTGEMMPIKVGYEDIRVYDAFTKDKLDNLPYEFYNGCAVVYNDEIHILGTEYSFQGNEPSFHYKWDGSSWTSVSRIPYNFVCGCAVVYNNEIHILGGTSYPTRHYKWDGSSWTSVSSLPYSFYDGSAVVYNNEIHILGGYNSGTYTKHYKWNGIEWTSASTLPMNFSRGSAVVYNNKLYIIGGGSSRSVYFYTGSSWYFVYSLIYPFYDGGAVVFNNEMHIFGIDSYYFRADENNRYDNGYLPYAFKDGCTVVYNNKIHILGGYYTGSEKYHYEISIFKSYKLIDNYTGQNSHSQSAVTYDNKIYLLWQRYMYTYSGFGWDLYSSIPYSFDGSAVVCNNEIHILGGTSYPTRHYKWDGSAWTSVSTIPYNFTRGSAVVYNNEIHLLGGYQSGTERYHYKWDGSSWTSVSTLPNRFERGSAIIYNNYIYTFGNYSSATYGKYIYKWGNEYPWTSDGILPYSIYRTSPAILNNEIHLIGGTSNYSTDQDKVESSDIILYPNISIYKFFKGTVNNGDYISLDGYIEQTNIIRSDSLEDQTKSNITPDDITIGDTVWANGEKVTGAIPNNLLEEDGSNISNRDLTIMTDKFYSGGYSWAEINDYGASLEDLGVEVDGGNGIGLFKYDGKILAFFTTDFFIIDPRKKTYEKGKDLLYPFRYGIVSLLSGILYLYGSYEGGYELKSQRLTLNANYKTTAWVAYPTTDIGTSVVDHRVGFGLAGKIWCIGDNTSSYVAGTAWSALTTTPRSFVNGIAVLYLNVAHLFIENYHYTFGGATTAASWTLISSDNPMSIGYSNYKAVTYKDYIYFFDKYGNYYYKYNFINDKWSNMIYISNGGNIIYDAVENNGDIYLATESYHSDKVRFYKFNEDKKSRFFIESNGDINVNKTTPYFGMRGGYLGYNTVDSKYIHIPRGKVFLLVTNGYANTNGTYRGSQTYIVYASGGITSTTALAAPKYVAMGSNGNSAIKLTATYTAVTGGASAYEPVLLLQAVSTAYNYDYSLIPLLTPTDDFLY